MPINKETHKITTFSVHKVLYRKLKAKLVLKDMTVTKWLEAKMKEEIKGT